MVDLIRCFRSTNIEYSITEHKHDYACIMKRARIPGFGFGFYAIHYKNGH